MNLLCSNSSHATKIKFLISIQLSIVKVKGKIAALTNEKKAQKNTSMSYKSKIVGKYSSL